MGHKSLAEQLYGWCKHFNGMMNKKCEKDVCYESVRVTTQTPYLYPCLRQIDNCPTAEYLTMEEAERQAMRERAEMDQKFAAIADARKAIIAALNGKFGAVTIPCPVCKTGTLLGSRSGYNKHVHGKCSTEGCVNWME